MYETDKIYEIRVRGHLDRIWLDLFEGLSLENGKAGDTVLVIPGNDQALLHGVLARVRDLNLTLLSVRRLGAPAGHRGYREAEEKDDR